MYEDAVITVVAAVILYYLDAVFTIRNKLCKHKILNWKHNDMRRFIKYFKNYSLSNYLNMTTYNILVMYIYICVYF